MGLVVVVALLSTGCGVKQWYRADLAARVDDGAPVSIQMKPVTYWQEFLGDVKTDEASDPMEFTLVNKLPKPITVEWDRCAFVDSGGSSHRVIHAGVRLMNRDQAQPPSVVGPGGRIEDLILPVDFVSLQGGRWRNLVYLPTDPKAVGKSYSFIIALTVEGKPVELTVPVELQKVSPTAQ